MRKRTPREEWPDIALAAATSRVEKARRLKARTLILSQRASLETIPSLVGLENLERLDLAGTHVEDISQLSNLPNLKSLNLALSRVRDIAPLGQLHSLTRLDIGWTRIVDLSPLAKLRNLEVLDVRGFLGEDVSPLADLFSLVHLSIWSSKQLLDADPISSLFRLEELNLSGTGITDLGFLSHLRNLKSLSMSGVTSEHFGAIGNLDELEALNIANTNCNNLFWIRGLKNLRHLYADQTPVTNIDPLTFCSNLETVSLRRTKISALGGISKLARLRNLDISDCPVEDLSAIANLTGLIGGASGLQFSGCPIKDRTLLNYAKLRGAARTTKVIEYLRAQQGLPPIVANEGDQLSLLDAHDLEPLEGLPSPFEYALNANGRVAALSSSANRPQLATARRRRDHAQRLEACRIHAADVREELSRSHNLRREYIDWLNRYIARLPTDPSDGNILLADAAARSLRNMFAADLDILPAPVASQLKTLLENYMGLRAFYPEVQSFHRDVREGRVTEPLSLDAVEGFASVVAKFTPAVFEHSVTQSLEATAEELPKIPAIPAEDRHPTPSQPIPPLDPISDIDPEKAHDISQASALNRLWKAVRSGAEVNKNVHAWMETIKEMAPLAQTIIRWLHDIFPDGPPHH